MKNTERDRDTNGSFSPDTESFGPFSLETETRPRVSPISATDSFQVSQEPTPMSPEGRNAPVTNNFYATAHQNMFTGMPPPVSEKEEVAKVVVRFWIGVYMVRHLVRISWKFKTLIPVFLIPIIRG